MVFWWVDGRGKVKGKVKREKKKKGRRKTRKTRRKNDEVEVFPLDWLSIFGNIVLFGKFLGF